MLKSLASVLILGFSTQVMAATVYTCNGIGDDKGQTVTLTVASESLVKVDEDRADRDTHYKPRLNKGFARFDYEQNSEGLSEVLVQEKLLSGADKGLIKIQNRGEGFGTSSYFCHL